ncbi:MAG: hypothetical protein ACK5G7_00305 [Erysipelotrichaceae bacterium]
MTKVECIELIKDFIQEELNGDIDRLANFDLKNIRKNIKFGGSDPDNTKIMNAIYIIVWGDKIKDLKFDELSSTGIYRGDTINSFRTLFGKPIRENDEITGFIGIRKHTDNKEILNIAKDFYYKYHTIGNMLPLVNKHSSHYSLNQYKGINGWHDYFDLFLIDLELCYQGNLKANSRKELNNYIVENSNFFSNYQGILGYKSLIEDFYLQPYVDAVSGHSKNVFAPNYYHYKKKKLTEDEYISCAKNYISKSLEIISYRSLKMIEKLKRYI